MSLKCLSLLQHSVRRRCWFAHTTHVSAVNKLLMDGSVDHNFAFFAFRDMQSFMGVARILSPFRQVIGSPFMSCEVCDGTVMVL